MDRAMGPPEPHHPSGTVLTRCPASLLLSHLRAPGSGSLCRPLRWGAFLSMQDGATTPSTDEQTEVWRVIQLVPVHAVIKWCWIYAVSPTPNDAPSLFLLRKPEVQCWPLVICSALCCLRIAHKKSAALSSWQSMPQRSWGPGILESELLPLDLVSQEMPEWLISPLGTEAQFRDRGKRSLRRHWALSVPFTTDVKTMPLHKRKIKIGTQKFFQVLS